MKLPPTTPATDPDARGKVLYAEGPPTQKDLSASVGLAHFERQYGNTTVSADVATASGGAGVTNPDGSVGFGAGAQGTIVGAQVTYEDPGGSVTFGLSWGAGVAASVGTKELADGRSALCYQVSAGPITLGACQPEPAPVKP